MKPAPLIRFLSVIVPSLVLVIPTQVCEAQTETVYDFSTNAGVDRFAFGNGIPQSTIPQVVNDIPSTEFSAADYTAVSVSDDARHTTGPVGNLNRSAVRFVFNIAEDAATITQLDVLW